MRIQELLLGIQLPLVSIASLGLCLDTFELGCRVLAIWLDFLRWLLELGLINYSLIVLHLHQLCLIQAWLLRALFLLRGWGPLTEFVWGVLPTPNDEIVDFRKDLDVAAIVHHYNVVIIRAIFMNRSLIWGAGRNDALFLSWRGRHGHPSNTSLLGMPSRALSCFFTTIRML